MILLRKNSVFMVRRYLLLICLQLLLWSNMYAQYTEKIINPFHERYYDSLKSMDYPYALPVFGKQAYKKGFDIPYTYGMSAVYFSQQQQIAITSTQVGINGSEKIDVSDIIGFGPIIASTNAYTVRPDIWLFPFLNVYGIFGYGTTKTNVILTEPTLFQTTQNFNATSAGVGATIAGGFGGVWVAWDNNFNWASIESLVEPVPAFNSSLRIGHNFVSPRHADRSLGIWAGTFYQKLKNDTKGSIAVQDVFPGFGSGGAFDAMREAAEKLPPAQEIIANKIIDELESAAAGIPTDSKIDYFLDKKVVAPFNLIFGAQFQLNKHWQFRTELGTFGKRSQFLLNANYRFETFKRKRK